MLFHKNIHFRNKAHSEDKNPDALFWEKFLIVRLTCVTKNVIVCVIKNAE